MSTLSIVYDDQSVTLKHIDLQGATELIVIDKHSSMFDIANMLYEVLEDFAPSVNVEIEES